MPKSAQCLALCLLLFVAGCSSIKKRQQEATVSIQEFHKEMNSGSADKVYDGASDEFKKAISREQWRKLSHNLSTKLGNHVSSADPSVFVNWTTNGTFVKGTCESKFQKASATETFNFVERGEKLELLGYNVNSSALLE